VDARNGWELQQKTVEVQRVRRQTKDKLKHMVGDHKRAMQNMVHERNTQVLAAKVKHEADVKNLLKQKNALVERTKEQRKNAKVALLVLWANTTTWHYDLVQLSARTRNWYEILMQNGKRAKFFSKGQVHWRRK
jgi:hypothetical protein